MAADSSISILKRGKVLSVNREYWKKLIKVDRIAAGISYWGTIGLITQDRFDEWLEHKIASGSFTDLLSFANYLAKELNDAAGDKLMRQNQPAGIHVAGMHEWEDGKLRPTFYHVHNGHLHVELEIPNDESSIFVLSGTLSPPYTTQTTYPTGSFLDTGSSVTPQLDPLLLQAIEQRSRATSRTVAQTRKRFQVHPDLAPRLTLDDGTVEGLDPSTADVKLKQPYMTHNGEYLLYKVVASTDSLSDLAFSNFKVQEPSGPLRLGDRVGILMRQMKLVIEKYRAHNLNRIIDGKPWVLGIKLDGNYIRDDDFKKREKQQIPPMTPRKKKE